MQAEAPDSSATERIAHDLEGFAFVPGGQTSMVSAIQVGSSADLLVDRYEVSRGQWRTSFGEDDPVPDEFDPSHLIRDPRPAAVAWVDDIPAVGMTLDEARHFAGLRGMRLLTLDEWLWCAVGWRCRSVPAGRRQRGFANTIEEMLGRATPAGTFESGQTPDTAIYDLLGNVWEWIEPPPDRFRDWKVANEAAWPNAARAPAWVMGGSYLHPEGPIFTRTARTGSLLANARATGDRSIDVGLRCGVDAAVYFGALPPQMNLSAPMRARMIAVGARWGKAAAAAVDAAAEDRPDNAWLMALRVGVEKSKS